jgi:hypothetical protein
MSPKSPNVRSPAALLPGWSSRRCQPRSTPMIRPTPSATIRRVMSWVISKVRVRANSSTGSVFKNSARSSRRHQMPSQGRPRNRAILASAASRSVAECKPTASACRIGRCPIVSLRRRFHSALAPMHSSYGRIHSRQEQNIRIPFRCGHDRPDEAAVQT